MKDNLMLIGELSLDELKTVMDGQTTAELLLNTLTQKQHAWPGAKGFERSIVAVNPA